MGTRARSAKLNPDMAGKSSFFNDKDCDLWRKVHAKYDEVLKLKSQTEAKGKGKPDLITLDKWYQEELPSILKNREHKFITKDELAKLMTWKLSRGKMRPMLPSLIQQNTESSVEEASRKAFGSLPDLSKAIKELSVLRGVGPATASAVLAAGDPESAPFMADESVLAVPEITVIKYDLKCYLTYAEAVKKATKELKKKDPEYDWNAHKTELSLWTYAMMQQLAPETLEKLQSESTPPLDLGRKASSPTPPKRKLEDSNGRINDSGDAKKKRIGTRQKKSQLE